MNRLLRRQIKRFGINLEEAPENWQLFIDSINDSYEHFEKDRQLIERTMDISSSELTTVNKQLREQKKALERSNEELKRFAYISAHDLKEPLRTIASFIQLVDRREKNISKESREFIQYAITGTKNMRSLLDDLMKYALIDAEDEILLEQQNLNEILDNVCLNLKGKIQANGALIEYPTLPSVYGEKSQLVQLFQNVIENSIKFRKEKNPNVKISSIPAIQEGYLQLSVLDNGIGIEKSYQEKVFQVFQRLHSPEKFDGTGIGLAICKKIIEKHTGNIWIDDSYRQGLKLDFTLPLAA